MSLREEMRKYEQITGESAEHVPIIKLGAFLDGYEMGLKSLEQTRWIPCSERMPEVSDYYLIQHSRHICSDEMAVAYYSVEEAECDENYTWEFKPFADCKEVIAWMPLPKPYKEDEENEM